MAGRPWGSGRDVDVFTADDCVSVAFTSNIFTTQLKFMFEPFARLLHVVLEDHWSKPACVAHISVELRPRAAADDARQDHVRYAQLHVT